MYDVKKIKSLEKPLNNAISELLFGGGSDPDEIELKTAAICFMVLKTLGLKVKNEKDVRDELIFDYIKGY